MFEPVSKIARATLSFGRTAVKLAPPEVRHFLRFAYRLPVYYAQDLSDQRCAEAELGVAVLSPAEGIEVVLPSDRIAHAVFRSFFFERETNREWREFLSLSQGCKMFADVGASGGTFSTLFARSRGDCEILSIEPDPTSVDVLHDVRSLNGRPSVKRWIVDPRAVGASSVKMTFISNGYGAEAVRESGNDMTKKFAVWNRREARVLTVDVERFDAICMSHQFLPDLIKIDTESYEYELIVSSIEFLRRVKPRIHLELHLAVLRERGLDPQLPLRLLQEIGYRLWQDKTDRPLSHLVHHAGDVPVIRMNLVCH